MPVTMKSRINGQVTMLGSPPTAAAVINATSAASIPPMTQIASTMAPLISGDDVSDWTAPNGQVYSVVVRLPETAHPAGDGRA